MKTKRAPMGPIATLISFAVISASIIQGGPELRAQLQERREMPIERGVEGSKQKSVDELLGDLVQRSNRGAIPALKKAFDESNDKFEKQRIASTLLRYGEGDTRFLDYLIRHAKAAIEDDMPFPVEFDKQGRTIGGKLSAEFLAWAARKGVDPKRAAEEALHSLPGDLMQLGATADARAFNILIRGLASKNYFVVASAAQGLARLQDKRAVGPIIEACRKAPAEAAELIAQALVFFDDAEAQAAAEQFIRDRALLESLRKRAREQGPKGIYGF